MGLTEDLRDYARLLELDFIGFCSAESFDEAPEDRRPRVYLEDARSIISIGYKLNYAPIQNLPTSRSAYMLEHDYANRHLDQASQKIARFLEERGFDAIGFDSGAGFYHEAGKTPERFAGDFSHKHAAVACGLGKFGLNNLVLSPRWGPRIRLAAVITSAKLGYDRPLEKNTCLTPECEECVKICPVHALDGWKGRYDPEKGWVIDKRKCYDYIFTTLKGQRCGLCIKACPVGLKG
ncbi:MAG: 4Fe-4S dicluster domain-containing protein [Candidatus Bathyarchaeota archaeon]|nr:4Fe-4S dicluster domain-containing protein [Candidatus Bathyarchaeota archaeon]